MCRKQAVDLTVPVLAGAGVCAAAGVAWFVVSYALVLAAGAAGICLLLLAGLVWLVRCHTVLCVPVRAAPPVAIRSPRELPERQLAAIVARSPVVIPGVVVSERQEVRR